MAWLKWLDTYSIGDKEIDRQHNDILELINKLYEFNPVQDKTELFSSLLDKMIIGCHIHTITERMYMEKIGRKNIDTHMNEHKILLDQMLRIKTVYTEEGIDHAKFLIATISRQLLDHIQEEKNIMAENAEYILTDQS